MYALFVGVSEVGSRARGLATYQLPSGEVHLEPFGFYMPSDLAQTSSVHQEFKSIQRSWLPRRPSPAREKRYLDEETLGCSVSALVTIANFFLFLGTPIPAPGCSEGLMGVLNEFVCSTIGVVVLQCTVGACAAVLKLNLDGNAAIDLFFQG
ncbi:hypothetical protein DFH08DRAFT_249086 [Mycena albidolilacea]|uniref:Uncharacterized protein n=1 Tax=Mycena albidolilacea TaxID=1033008 RepID=A0AAD6ZUH7_9AGAR|nr:hypothetical protein DFH08DRAFT_249086 [Mycena albidolilacea]